MKPIIRSIASKVAVSTSINSLASFGLDHNHNHYNDYPSMASTFHHPHPWRRRNCLWPYWSTVDRPQGTTPSLGHLVAQKEAFIPSSPARCTNNHGFVTIPGVETIDPFLLSLRFYGFDLWMSRYAETGKRYLKRNFVTKLMFYAAILMINLQMAVHILTTGHVFWTQGKNFYSSLDDLRTFILKFTMTFAVNFWFLS